MKQPTFFTVFTVLGNLLLASVMHMAVAQANWAETAEDINDESFGVTVRDGIPMGVLSNFKTMPLVGLGVGTLQHYMVPLMVAGAFQEDKKTRLIETGQVAENEHLIAAGINQGIDRLEGDEKVELHVITKIWYTHLGYERTKLAVRDSFDKLKDALENERVDLRVHLMIHWPRCYTQIPWMKCQEEEESLPEEVKKAGPPSYLDKEAWKQSWKALEEMYQSQEYAIESIGVANFNIVHLEELESFAKVQPHILQVSLWSLLYDAHIVEHCHRNKIHIQVYNIMTTVLSDSSKAPNAFDHLLKVADELSDDSSEEVSVAQVLLSWLVQHGVSVIPRTSRLSRLRENSAVALSQVPALSDAQVETVAHAVEAFLSGRDLEEDMNVKITFHAPSIHTMLYWNHPDGGEVQVAYIPEGEQFNETTYPHHTYRLYNASNKDVYEEFTVDAKFGEHVHVHAFKSED